MAPLPLLVRTVFAKSEIERERALGWSFFEEFHHYFNI